MYDDSVDCTNLVMYDDSVDCTNLVDLLGVPVRLGGFGETLVGRLLVESSLVFITCLT